MHAEKRRRVSPSVEVPYNQEDVDDVEDTDDSRFYGGGLNDQQEQILDLMDDGAEGNSGPAVFDSAALRKQAAKFERAITRNSQMRLKFSDDPTKFLESEAELDVQIRNLADMVHYPALYSEFISLGCLESLVGLIGHENKDVACDAIRIVDEMTDPDNETSESDMQLLLKSLGNADFFNYLISNMQRLDETSDEERAGVYHSLSVLENIFSVDASTKDEVCRSTKLILFLKRSLKATTSIIDQNCQYKAEILSILVEGAVLAAEQLIEDEGVDLILQLLSFFRNRDPEKATPEEEYMENLFDTVCALVRLPAGKDKFLIGEGVELMQRMIAESKSCKTQAIKVLDYACSTFKGGAVCEQMVEVGLLRTLFSLLTKKSAKELRENLLSILLSFMRCLAAGESGRFRVFAKWTEKDGTKIKNLINMREDYLLRLKMVNGRIEAERAHISEEDLQEYEAQWYFDRIDAGLHYLQTIDLIITWLYAEEIGTRMVITSALETYGHSLLDLKATLEEYSSNLRGQQTGDNKDDEHVLIIQGE